MNIADALFSRSFEDGQLIIKQVGYMPFVKKNHSIRFCILTMATKCLTGCSL